MYIYINKLNQTDIPLCSWNWWWQSLARICIPHLALQGRNPGFGCLAATLLAMWGAYKGWWEKSGTLFLKFGPQSGQEFSLSHLRMGNLLLNNFHVLTPCPQCIARWKPCSWHVPSEPELARKWVANSSKTCNSFEDNGKIWKAFVPNFFFRPFALFCGDFRPFCTYFRAFAVLKKTRLCPQLWISHMNFIWMVPLSYQLSALSAIKVFKALRSSSGMETLGESV